MISVTHRIRARGVRALTGLLLLTAFVTAGAGVAQEAGPEFHLTFKGKPEAGPELHLLGPDAENCVRCEPDGLRITLPLGFAGERRFTGVGVPVTIQGDFEISAAFEIFQEPEPGDAGQRGTKLNLTALLDSPQGSQMSLARRVPGQGPTRFSTYTVVTNEDPAKKKTRYKNFPTETRVGRLRIVRTGNVVSYHVAEGADGEFTLLDECPGGTEALAGVQLVGSTGGPKAALDVRFTDLRVRAGRSQAAAQSPTTEPRQGVGSLELIGGLAALLLVAGGAAWLLARRRRATPAHAAGEGPSPGRAGSVVVSCEGCGKPLRARAESAGKKVKCPQCGRLTVVPPAQPVEDSPSV